MQGKFESRIVYSYNNPMLKMNIEKYININ